MSNVVDGNFNKNFKVVRHFDYLDDKIFHPFMTYTYSMKSRKAKQIKLCIDDMKTTGLKTEYHTKSSHSKH
jgi:hypothetical protein